MQLLRMCAGMLLAVTVSRGAFGTPSAEPAQFTRTSTPIAVDGHLDEAAWISAKPVTRFFEVYPGDIAEPTVRTEARFLYDDENVYVGISALDPDTASIRSGFVRRDGVTMDQDYLEIYIDPLNTRQSALVFRTNAAGIANDAQYNEDQQLLDSRPDLNFDIRTSLDAQGWRAEFRIPLSTLRYRPGSDQSWAFMIFRNRPRNGKTTIASIPQPRSTACALCFAGEVTGISTGTPSTPMYVTPHATYTYGDDIDELGAGIDAKWVMHSDTVLDLTLAPDFSQVEADDLQLTANAQFTLALKEKRPFFLEATDLFAMPVNAVYTRSFADPDAGARLTHRGNESSYSALVLHDGGGGIALEPGPLSSTAALQDFGSTAVVGRYTRQLGALTWGTLLSGRLNDGDGENYVYGFDGTWTPNTTDRFSVQLLNSSTTNPNRPDLLPTWDGRQLDGSAYAASWQHASTRWYATATQSMYSSGFRAWNGFVPQTDIASSSASAGLLFFTQHRLLQRFAPGVLYSGVRELGGNELSSDLYPYLSFSMPYGTELSIGWHPHAKTTTLFGASTYRFLSATVTTTPAPWLRGLSLMASSGDGVDFSTGKVNEAASLVAQIPLHLTDRLELSANFGYQTQDSRDAGRKQRLFTQRNLQVNLLWHFSNRLYAQVLYQDSRFSSRAAVAGQADLASKSRTVSGLLSYQTNWQTRFFIGARYSSSDFGTQTSNTEVFAKIAYVLPRWN